MVTDFLFWIVLAFVMAMLVIWWRMYEVLKDKVHNNYKSLCEIERTIDEHIGIRINIARHSRKITAHKFLELLRQTASCSKEI